MLPAELREAALRPELFLGNFVDEIILVMLVDLLLSLSNLLSVHLLHLEGLLDLRVQLDFRAGTRVD